MVVWILSGICLAGIAFMVRFFLALHAELRRGERPRVQRIESESLHYGCEIINTANLGQEQHSLEHHQGRLLQFSRRSGRSKKSAWLMVFALATLTARAQTATTSTAASDPSDQLSSAPEWQYGAFVDAAYLKDFNHPLNDLFRSRGTTYKLDEPLVNMSAAYLRKAATATSRWGMEVTVQAGQDTRVFGFSATAPNLQGSAGLRHLGPTDVSYLAPIGKGLTIQGGIFASLIGYDGLYAKDNFTYTRPWGADFTPYLMLGINASYPVTNKLTATGFVVNDYFHLADPNSVPSFGGQLAYKGSSRLNLKQTVMYGPHQADTSVEFWRFLADTIAEYKTERFTTAFEYHVGTEKVAAVGHPQAVWMAAQLPLHFVLNKHWSVTERPEVYWDSTGRITGFAQTVKANTATIEYRVPFHQAAAIFRLEHRVDDSRGPQGGFFTDRLSSPGVLALTPTQHLLAVAVILTFDGSFRR